MKTLKIQLLTILLALGAGTAAWGKDDPNARNIAEARAEVQMDLEQIRQHRGEIECLQSEMKADKDAKRKLDVRIDKEELAKSKAELRAAKAELRADKKALKREYRLAIEQMQEDIEEACFLAHSAEWDLEKTKVYGSQNSIRRDANYAVRRKGQLHAHQDALTAFREERDYEMIALNNEIRESKTQIAYIGRPDDPNAYAGNCVMR